MHIDDLVRNPQYRDYVCCLHGFAFCGNKLEPYTRNGLQSVHRSVYCKLAGKQACTQRCSEVFGRQFSRWCNTCQKWRQHLTSESKLQNVCWEKLKSWEWPCAYENIAESFIPASWTMPDFQDISTLCHIWENCKNGFTIRSIVISNLRKCRNTYIAHNPKLIVNELEKAKIFDALKDLFKDPDVQKYTNAQECLSQLEAIENGDTLSASLKSVFKSLNENTEAVENLRNTVDVVALSQKNIELSHEQQVSTNETVEKIHDVQNKCSETLGILHKRSDIVQETLNEVSLKQNRIESSVSELEDKQIEANGKLQDYHKMLVRLLMKQPQAKENDKRFVPYCLLFTAVLVAIVAVLLAVHARYLHKYKHVDKSWDRTGCISETYRYPFEQDMPLLGYFYDHDPTVGREWLFEATESKLMAPNSSSKGIALIAEMGYGKSAFVSHLICSKKGEKGYGIKSHVVSFHICRFDVKSTQSPVRFIRRLVGFLATENEEYGNIISLLPDYNILYNEEACSFDPNACFDQGIIFPFKKLSHVSNVPWIFIIEALDECYQKSSNRNPIMELLSSRIRQLPTWVKVFITSRNMSELYTIAQLDYLNLQTNDPRNIADIREYIKATNMQNRFDINQKELETLIRRSEGNFLFIIHAIRYLINSRNQSVVTLPATLEDVYEINFDRQFCGIYSFSIPKAIFEIVFTTLHPIKAEEVLHILKVNNVTGAEQFSFQMNKMSFFLRMENSVTIIHQSLFQWLTNTRNQKYMISLKAGHEYISRYLFHQVSLKRETDLADFSIHVSEASNEILIKHFLTLNITSFNETNVNEALHNVISKRSDINAVKLLISHNLDVNKQKGDGTSPAFVAAARGNIDQLELLLENGANINFVMESDVVVDSYDILNKIEAIKQGRYYGYGLIHVAARHGHAKVVSKLLKHNEDMIDWKTSLGQRASDIACEAGKLEVVLTISEWSSEMLFDCIYYASKFDNVNIIQFLIGREAQLNCISDKQSISAIEQMQIDDSPKLKLKQDFYRERHPVYHKIYPHDKWWIAAKETPILAAIRAGSVDAASLLIKHYTTILNCSDSFGYTALLLTVVKNQYTLLPLLKDNIFTDRCAEAPHHIQSCYRDSSMNMWNFLNGPCLALDGLKDIEELFCPSGASFAHLVAIYNRKDFLRFSLQEDVNIEWNTADDEGNYPIHYAARYTNVDFITMALTELTLNISNIKCRNGSTAYHIAAITPSLRSFYALTNKFQTVIPEVEDENEMGILHHTVLSSQKFKYLRYDYRMLFQNCTLYIFKYLVRLCDHNIQKPDAFGRNVLHYALINGHFSVIEFIKSNYPFEFRQMLGHADANNQTPVQYSLAEAKAVETESRYRIDVFAYFDPNSFSDYSNQFEICFLKKEMCVNLHQAWEIAFIFTIRGLSLGDFRTLIEPFLYQVLVKSKTVSNAILIYHNHLTDEDLGKHIIQSLDTDTQPSAEILKDIARYRPSVFHQCGQPLKRSPLHYLALKDKCLLTANVVVQLCLGVEHNISTWNVFNCVDERGLNVFHYALMKGDTQTATVLLNAMEKSDKVSVEDIIMITILREQIPYQSCKHIVYSKYYYRLMHTFGRRPTLSTQEEDDLLISSFIRRYKDVLQPTDFCKNNSKMLSVVHILFASEMKTTLKTIVEIYGHDILNCRNSDRFTPRYIAKLFDYKDLDEFFDENTEIMQPYQYAEKYLVLLILSDILSRLKLDNIPDCVFQHRSRVNRLYLTEITKDYMCIERFLHHKLRYFSTTDYCSSQRKIIKILRSVLYTENHNYMRCLDLLKLIETMESMLNKLMTCMDVSFSNWTPSQAAPFAFIAYEKLRLRFSNFKENLNNCDGTEEDIELSWKRFRNIILSVRNFIVYILKQQRELIILKDFSHSLFDKHYIEVFSGNGFEYLLSKMAGIKTESGARWVSKEGWTFNYLNVLRKTSAYKRLKTQIDTRYVQLDKKLKVEGNP